MVRHIWGDLVLSLLCIFRVVMWWSGSIFTNSHVCAIIGRMDFSSYTSLDTYEEPNGCLKISL
jgi:hypothetical protein